MKTKANLERTTSVLLRENPDRTAEKIQPLPAPVSTSLGVARPPYITEVEVNCDDCGGSGFDSGGLDPWGPEVCPVCHGAKTQRITRNYLAEAFQIAANQESERSIERQHLVAVIQHCRETVSALVVLPEVA
jgi:hypothetical protein